MKITAIQALKDNFIWALIKKNDCIIVDPGEASPTINFLQKNNLNLKAALITHHHNDHTQGLHELLQIWPKTIVYGHSNSPCKLINKKIGQEKAFYEATIQQFILPLMTPGHTLCHITYFIKTTPPIAFTGDTLFSAGCGKIFEGTAPMLYTSLEKINNLPKNTKIYCGHEYTLNNLNFAETIEPTNMAIKMHINWCKEQIKNNLHTVPSTLELEQRINPFLRCQTNEIENAMLKTTKNHSSTEIFAQLRQWKDTF